MKTCQLFGISVLLAVSAFGFSQNDIAGDASTKAQIPTGDLTPKTTISETDGGTEFFTKTETSYVRVHPIPGTTRIRAGRAGEYVWNYYAKAHEFRRECIAGVRIEVDRNDIPFRKVACGNVLIADRTIPVTTKTITKEHTVIREIRTEVPVPCYRDRIVEKPVPYVRTQYVALMIYGPTTQYIGSLGSPTVVGGSGGGVAYSAGSRTSLTAFGGAGGAGGSNSTNVNVNNNNNNSNSNSNANSNSNSNVNGNSNGH